MPGLVPGRKTGRIAEPWARARNAVAWSVALLTNRVTRRRKSSDAEDDQSGYGRRHQPQCASLYQGGNQGTEFGDIDQFCCFRSLNAASSALLAPASAVIKISRTRNRLIAFGARVEHLINLGGCSTVNRVLVLPTNMGLLNGVQNDARAARLQLILTHAP